MSKTQSFLWRGLAALFLLVLLIGGGVAVHLVGWSQGYQSAQVAAEGEVASPPYMPEGWRPVPIVPFGYGAGSLLRIFLLLLFFGLIVKLFFMAFRFLAWGVIGGPAMVSKHWSQHWTRRGRWSRRYPHGPMPPWFHGWCDPWEEEADDESAGDAEA